MSIQVPLAQVTDAQSQLIRQFCVFQPKVPFQFNRNKFAKPEAPNPIVFYSTDGTTLSLPKAVGRRLFPGTENTETAPADFTFTGTLKPDQVPVVEQAMGHLRADGDVLLELFPGFGKTIVSACLASQCQQLTVVLCHREFLLVQWFKTFTDFTTAKPWIVGTKVPAHGCDVIICMEGQTHKLPVEYRKRIGTMIVDEAHCFAVSSRTVPLLAFQPKYIIICSATLERVDGMHEMIFALAGLNRITKISTKPFTVIKYLTGITPETKEGRQGGVDWTGVVRNLAENEQRNEMICRLVQRYRDKKILILCSLVDHVNHLKEKLVALGENVDSMAGKKKSYSNSRVLVGSVSLVGTGFDEANACADYDGTRINLVIIAFSTKNAGLLEQTVGRGFRSEFPLIIHLYDDLKAIKRHWTEAKKWYLSRNGSIVQEEATSA